MDADIATATKDLISQDISIHMEAQEKVKFLSSITSLSIRLPAFDHIYHNNKKYLKIKSNEFLFAKSSLTESSSSGDEIVIVPTDDPKLKAVIIPQACLT